MGVVAIDRKTAKSESAFTRARVRGGESLTVTLSPVPGDPRPVDVRWRLALKLLLRRCGLRASWPTSDVQPSTEGATGATR